MGGDSETLDSIEDADLDVEAFEKAINDMLPGLANHARDVNLAPEVAALYKPGLILRDRGIVDASGRIGGMVTTHRFAILSNHMADISQFEHGTNWGLCIAKPDSHFKVIDVYEYRGKTQITLLHLLDDERWRMFENVEFDAPGLSIEDIRSRFEARCREEPIPELTTETWLERCEWPVGTNPDGELYSPDPKPAEASWPVAGTSFRAFVGNVVFIFKGEEDDGRWLHAVPDEGVESIFAYGYIDKDCGLSFRCLYPASVEDDQWVAYEGGKDVMSIIRAGALENAFWCPTGIDPAEFEPLTGETDKYYTPSEAVLRLREEEFLDPIRHPLFPDDVQAYLVGPNGKGLEVVWLRLCDLNDGKVFAKLLNEPNNDWGIHEGDKLPLSLSKDDQDGLVAAVLIDEL